MITTLPRGQSPATIGGAGAPARTINAAPAATTAPAASINAAPAATAPPSVIPASANASVSPDAPDISSATVVTAAPNRSSTADGTVVLDPAIAVGGIAMPVLPSAATKNNKYDWKSTDWNIRWESIAVTAAETNITVGRKNEFTKLLGINVDGHLILATKEQTKHTQK
mmetsp:Transcript_26449/g.47688  ORF Transcript_26449/g.47688 Transcript_26449/m.47688 type:complete len:169 (-) Transcript_26449:452-958(-)